MTLVEPCEGAVVTATNGLYPPVIVMSLVKLMATGVLAVVEADAFAAVAATAS
jgi:hypothetical protein